MESSRKDGVAKAITIVAVLSFCVCYPFFMSRDTKRQEVEDVPQKQVDEDAGSTAEPQSVGTEGTAVKEEDHGFYIRACNGYAAVYSPDGQIYQYTSIPLTSLPEELRQKIEAEGYYIMNQRDLYGFLENYSS